VYNIYFPFNYYFLKKCLNCGSPVTANYCSECGQKTSIKGVNSRILLEEILHFFTHLERDFFRTTWQLLVNPGKMLSRYLKGERKKFHSPVSFLLVWVTLQVLLRKWIINYYHLEWTFIEAIDEQNKYLFNEYSSLFTLIILPFAAFINYLFLARPRFNYSEMLIVFIYITAGLHFLIIINDIILGMIFHINIISWQIQLVEMNILIAVYNLWFCYSFYKNREMKHFWLRLILNLIVTGFVLDRLTVIVPWGFRQINQLFS